LLAGGLFWANMIPAATRTEAAIMNCHVFLIGTPPQSVNTVCKEGMAGDLERVPGQGSPQAVLSQFVPATTDYAIATERLHHPIRTKGLGIFGSTAPEMLVEAR